MTNPDLPENWTTDNLIPLWQEHLRHRTAFLGHLNQAGIETVIQERIQEEISALRTAPLYWLTTAARNTAQQRATDMLGTFNPDRINYPDPKGVIFFEHPCHLPARKLTDLHTGRTLTDYPLHALSWHPTKNSTCGPEINLYASTHNLIPITEAPYTDTDSLYCWATLTLPVGRRLNFTTPEDFFHPDPWLPLDEDPGITEHALAVLFGLICSHISSARSTHQKLGERITLIG